MLTCGCQDDYEWYYVASEDYITYSKDKNTRCKSCNKKIKQNDLVIEFRKLDEDTKAKFLWYFCEDCADIYYNLDELNYCIDIEDSMPDLLDEYRKYQEEDD